MHCGVRGLPGNYELPCHSGYLLNQLPYHSGYLYHLSCHSDRT